MKIKLETENYSREIDIYSEEGTELIADLWTKVSFQKKLMYEPTWLGIPIIQYPDDMVMMQELIWKLRPDVIVETGVAHGGSAILYASVLELLGRGEVIGIDIEIRKHNELAIRSHPLSRRVDLVEGSSTDRKVFEEVRRRLQPCNNVLVVLDSNHTHEHVLSEMELYNDLVSPGGYMVVMDGVQEMLSDTPSGKKEWQQDNPLAAIREFLSKHPDWEPDPYYARMCITCNPSGFLRRREEM